MSVSTHRNLRNSIYLIGENCEVITGSKLPSKRQALQALFHKIRTLNKSLKDGYALVIDEIEVFWQKAGIPTRKKCHSQKILENLYNEWRTLQKSSNKHTPMQKQKEEDFVENLDNLFDIAHTQALDMIRIEEDKLFLLNQRKKGRLGSMLGVDEKLARKEKRTAERLEKEVKRKKKQSTDVKSTEVNNGDLEISSLSSDECLEDTDFQPSSTSSCFPTSSAPKTKINIFNDKLIAVLDRFRVTDHAAAFIIEALLENLGHDPNDFCISRQSIRRNRQAIRADEAKNIKAEFNPKNPLIVHWDSKLLHDSKTDRMEWLPVIVQGLDCNQILEIRKTENGTGEEHANAVYQSLLNWQCEDKVKGMCFDTTASNTGRIKGACTILEHYLGRELSYFACRHHIFELVLRGVFEKCLKVPTRSPDVQIFKKFQNEWSNFDLTTYKTYIYDTKVEESLKEVRDDILAFSLGRLEKESEVREDYREFLELVVIFLGGTPPRGITFRKPGAIHHARWMAKALYSLKMFMFQEQFSLSANEKNAIANVCTFIVYAYVKAWFTSTNAATAPFNDLNFLKTLIHFSSINKIVASTALKKFCGHLWYLSEEMVALSLFDDKVPLEEKKLLVNAMNDADADDDDISDDDENDDENDDDEEINSVKRITLKLNTPAKRSKFMNKKISDFASKKTKKFLTRFNICSDFLEQPIENWFECESYVNGLEIVRSIEVCNDRAERGIALVEKFANFGTKDENQKQCIMQIVQRHRETYQYK